MTQWPVFLHKEMFWRHWMGDPYEWPNGLFPLNHAKLLKGIANFLVAMRWQLKACRWARGSQFTFGTSICAYLLKRVLTLRPHIVSKMKGWGSLKWADGESGWDNKETVVWPVSSEPSSLHIGMAKNSRKILIVLCYSGDSLKKFLMETWKGCCSWSPSHTKRIS